MDLFFKTMEAGLGGEETLAPKECPIVTVKYQWKPDHSDVQICGIGFNPKKSRVTSQIKMINVSLMVGQYIVEQYTAWN